MEGTRTAKIIEGKTNEIPRKTLEGIRTAKILNIFNIYSINDIKKQKRKALERELNCVFIRINPDAVDFNIFREITKIHGHIKKSSKKSLIDKISERLVEVEFKSDHSINQSVNGLLKKYSLHYKKCIFIVKSVINIQVIHIQRK